MTLPETIAALRKARSRETHLYVTGTEPKLSSMSSEIPNVNKEDLAKIADLIEKSCAVRYRIVDATWASNGNLPSGPFVMVNETEWEAFVAAVQALEGKETE